MSETKETKKRKRNLLIDNLNSFLEQSEAGAVFSNSNLINFTKSFLKLAKAQANVVRLADDLVTYKLGEAQDAQYKKWLRAELYKFYKEEVVSTTDSKKEYYNSKAFEDCFFSSNEEAVMLPLEAYLARNNSGGSDFNSE